MINKFMFYDFETFGINTMRSKSSQIGAVMTDANFNILEEIEFFCKPMESSLPEIPACLITGFTPESLNQKSQNIFSEYEFFHKLNSIFQSNTNMCVLGFNSYKYDDEIIRHSFYRNLISPYEREYTKGNSKFDIFHFTRAFAFLFPDQIKVPYNEEAQRPSFKLEELAKANNLDLTRAHDALSDVYSTIALAKHMQSQQPDFWELCLKTKDKNSVINFVNQNKEFFLYSPYFPHEKGYFGFTQLLENVAGDNPQEKFVLVAENVNDIKKMLSMTPAQIAEEMNKKNDERSLNIPISSFKMNAGPFLFTTKSLVKEAGIQPTCKFKSIFNLEEVQEARQFIKENIEDINKFVQAVIKERAPFVSGTDVDMQLYSKFIDRGDEATMKKFHTDMSKGTVEVYESYFTKKHFKDERLNELAQRVILRNFYSEDLNSLILSSAYCALLKSHLGTDYPVDFPYRERNSNLSLNEFKSQLQDYQSKEEYKNDPIIKSLISYEQQVRANFELMQSKYDVKPKSLKM